MRANTDFILTGVMNSGNDIDPVAERVAEREAQLQPREEIRLFLRRDHRPDRAQDNVLGYSEGSQCHLLRAVPKQGGKEHLSSLGALREP